MNEPTDDSFPRLSTSPLTTGGDSDTDFIPAGGQIGEFELIEKLGEGAFGQVFLARQASLERTVALKVTREPRRKVTEGQLLAGLEHDNIVKVFTEFSDPTTGLQGLCLQYVPGADLGTIVRHLHEENSRALSGLAILQALDRHRRGEAGFDPRALRDRDTLARDDFAQAVCRIGSHLAEALAFAHARGVLHCDIKPANILMSPYGRPMLADFNVAFDRNRIGMTGTGGTISYMAPEHRAALMGTGGQVDERSDIYSLGVVLHELFTGKRPSATVDRLQQMPCELASVLRRCLAPDPADRYQSAGELAKALTATLHLLNARQALPKPGRLASSVEASPIAWLVVAALLPHFIASVVNITYNAVEIELNSEQLRVFAGLVLGYNLVAYTVCFGTACLLLRQIRNRLHTLPTATGAATDDLRHRVLNLGWWAMALGSLGWFPGALIFPLVIDWLAGPVDWTTYAHYALSFTLAGLIAVVFGYLGITYVVFRALLPHLGNPDRYSAAAAWNEVRPITVPFAPFLMLACAVPLVGAVLLVAFAEGVMTLGFRLLVTGLIGLGVAGVGIAERLTRQLRDLAAIWRV